jgi:hypothetical protein
MNQLYSRPGLSTAPELLHSRLSSEQALPQRFKKGVFSAQNTPFLKMRLYLEKE